MAMLMHTRQPFERAPASMQQRRETIRESAAEAGRTTIRQFCISALAVLTVAGALAAITALKAAIYYWRFH